MKEDCLFLLLHGRIARDNTTVQVRPYARKHDCTKPQNHKTTSSFTALLNSLPPHLHDGLQIRPSSHPQPPPRPQVVHPIRQPAHNRQLGHGVHPTEPHCLVGETENRHACNDRAVAEDGVHGTHRGFIVDVGVLRRVVIGRRDVDKGERGTVEARMTRAKKVDFFHAERTVAVVEEGDGRGGTVRFLRGWRGGWRR